MCLVSLTQSNYTQAPPASPNVTVIFGAGGDLTRRKLIPALFHLCDAGLLSDNFAVLGLGRRDVDDDSFRDLMAEHIRDYVGTAFDQSVWERLVERLHYMKIDILDGADYERLRACLEELDARRGTEGNYLFYTAIPPSLFTRVDRLPGRGRPIAGDREQLAARRRREAFRAGSGIRGGLQLRRRCRTS